MLYFSTDKTAHMNTPGGRMDPAEIRAAAARDPLNLLDHAIVGRIAASGGNSAAGDKLLSEGCAAFFIAAAGLTRAEK